MKIQNFDTSEKVLIIAEIGNNHEGSIEVAKQMVRAVAKCGADAVKFQTFKTEHYVSRRDAARFGRMKSFELTYEQFEELSHLAHECGLFFISTPFDLESARFLASIVDSYKIASGDNNFIPLIQCVLDTNKPLMVSTGISDSTSVDALMHCIKHRVSEKEISDSISLLHCVSSYPTPPECASLSSITYLSDKYECTVGYSDHTLGIDAAVAAAVLGARIIEKHFTLDKNYSDFRDHKMSADSEELRELVQGVRKVSLMLGANEKKRESCEEDLVLAIRRSIVASRNASQGHVIQEEDLTWVRPGGGLPPGNEHVLIGKRLNKDVCIGDLLLASDVE